MTHITFIPADSGATTVTLCARCGLRPATETWTESAFAFAHGLFQRWCKRCVVEAQLAFAREVAARIPRLEAELEHCDA